MVRHHRDTVRFRDEERKQNATRQSRQREETHMAAYFSANNSVNNNNWQLYKLGDDQSVTQWTAINNMGVGFGFLPLDPTLFNNAVWYDGNTATQGRQLYRLLPDGSFTLWTPINPGGGGLFPDPIPNPNPPPVDVDLTVFNN